MSDSTGAVVTRKPDARFPLWVHQGKDKAGNQKSPPRWCKKIRGKFHYFGHVADDSDGQKALATWLPQRDDLLAGRTLKKPSAEGVNVWELCQRFLTFK